MAGSSSLRASGSYFYSVNAPNQYPVADVVIFPQYVRSRSNHDIALIRMAQPLPFYPAASINSICLPQSNQSLGSVATVSGWGQTSENGGSATFLRSVEVSIQPDR